MKSFMLYAAAGTALIALSSTAQSREFADIYTDCGLGAMIAPNNDAVAAVTNVTFDLGTTAISSNASSEENCKGADANSAAYIINTYASLEKEIAKGEGDHIVALFDINQCDSASQPQLTNELRNNFSDYASSSTYTSDTSIQKSENMYNMVKTVTTSCNRI